MFNLHSYTFRANYSPQDDKYIGTCDQVPSLSHIDKDIPSTIKGITELVLGVIADLNKDEDNDKHSTAETETESSSKP